MRVFNKISLVYFFLCLTIACEEDRKVTEEDEFSEILTQVENKYAPDGRVAIFEAEIIKDGNNVILKGQTDSPEAEKELIQRLEEKDVVFTDSLELLPSSKLGDKVYALASNSVSNMRSEPGHSSELATQALLGTPLNVLQQKEDWFLVQTPDQYIAWVDSGGIFRLTEEELKSWKNKEKIIYTAASGYAYLSTEPDAEIVSDLVAGNVLELQEEKGDYYKVVYPDGRTGYVKKSEADVLNQWLSDLQKLENDLVETSETMMGAPYLWGGTSSKGVDCSGFTKTIYFMNGYVIPRDASQQVRTGVLVDSVKDFSNHRPGDLLFFGRPATDSTAERVVHVGMWIGDNKFIHSMGKVHISSFDKDDPNFDIYNYGRYLRTKRLLGQDDEEIIELGKNKLYTQ